MNNISLIIGAGFSEPAKLPSTDFLNNFLSKIDYSEICIHHNEVIEFLNGRASPYPEIMKVKLKERNFIQRILEYYNKDVLIDGQSFHYEDFYDFYQVLKESLNYLKDTDDLFSEFIDENCANDAKHQLLADFDRYFNQMIAIKLFKKFNDPLSCDTYYSFYKAFSLLIEGLIQSYTIHIHSLNHDLLIEYLSLSGNLQCDLNDGFEEVGSPFYGLLLNNEPDYYTVRLSRFINKYTSNFRLYKLHGSIDHYWFGNNENYELIKIKDGLDISRNNIKKEVEENGIKTYKSESLNLYPDFLSGRKYKIKKYKRGTYYPVVFDHFQNNLNNSKTLIIIGYGLRDDEINKFILKFAQDNNKKVFVVDIRKSNHELFERENVVFIKDGVVNMDYKSIINEIN